MVPLVNRDNRFQYASLVSDASKSNIGPLNNPERCRLEGTLILCNLALLRFGGTTFLSSQQLFHFPLRAGSHIKLAFNSSVVDCNIDQCFQTLRNHF